MHVYKDNAVTFLFRYIKGIRMPGNHIVISIARNRPALSSTPRSGLKKRTIDAIYKPRYNQQKQ